MNADGQALLQGILDHPDDDDQRLIFADWLQEQGEDARAEFIRVSIALTKVKSKCGSEGGDFLCRSMACELCPLIRRMNAAWLEFKIGNAPPLGLVDTLRCLRGFNLRLPFGPDHTAPVAHFNRGFIEILHCTIRQWLDVADDATARHPIREVYFTLHPQGAPLPFSYDVDGMWLILRVKSHHGMKIVVDANITVGDIDHVIMKMFKAQWPKIVFRWNAFSIGN